ncbi:hypothetical protein [Salinigranum marinum]|uniref:hypothetical protein n=1 Tax=Salinigranum marinum TaxID=1515595 RepID=UPI002989A6F0|nr:hypothetical protein [Salinigranum marinum]
MTVGSALQELGRVLDEFDRAAVRNVGVVEPAEADGARGVTADVELTVSTQPDAEGGAEPVSLATATVEADGQLRLAFESADALVPTTDRDVTIEPTAVAVDDGAITVALSVSVPVRSDAGPADGERPVPAGEPDDWDGADGGRGDGNGRHGDDGLGGRDGRVERDSGAERDGGADTDSHGKRGGGDRSVPPFRDPELLAEVYDSCGTFAEMADTLGMDVTAETVRRYMIDAGVHQPNSYDTKGNAGGPTADGDEDGGTEERENTERDGGVDSDAGTEAEVTPEPEGGPATADGSEPEDEPGTDAGASEPVVLADGIGLPNDVTVETLVETVKRSNTVYEIKRDIGVDREDAVEMLRELNLLDLVVGRLATEAERDISRAEVVERLREASATQ